MSKHIHSYLALGDSYTIGEGVPLHHCYPYQLVQLLRGQQVQVHAPEIVAQTGWTTFELAEHLIHHHLEPAYDWVTLLIGVNNQYRGLATEDYANEFEFLLKKAIHLAHGLPAQVWVLSIPDWGVTPFAADRDRAEIAAAIDTFNFLNKAITEKYQCHYVDITGLTRAHGADEDWLAADRLHYGGRMYAAWAGMLLDSVRQQIAQR